MIPTKISMVPFADLEKRILKFQSLKDPKQSNKRRTEIIKLEASPNSISKHTMEPQKPKQHGY